MTFHLRDGLCFHADKDGSVTIRWADRELTVPANEWASVLAATCVRGETGESYRDALDFHTPLSHVDEERFRRIAREEAQAVVAKTLMRLIDNAEREDRAADQ